MKKLRYFYQVHPDVPEQDRPGLIWGVRKQFENSTGFYRCEQLGGLLVLERTNNKWTANYTHTGLGTSIDENSAWGILGLAERFQLVRIVIEYNNALLPYVSRRSRRFDWRNGESEWGDELHAIVVTCLPTPKTVTISAKIDPVKDQDKQRVKLLETVWRIEKMILRTKVLIRLNKAVKAGKVTGKFNHARIDRYVTGLFGLIGEA